MDTNSILDPESWSQIKRIAAERVQSGKKITEIKSHDGVTVKVGNLSLKKTTTMPPPAKNSVHGTYREWSIRVWNLSSDKFACQIGKAGHNDRYFEVTTAEAKDENVVFILAQNLIEDLEAE